jgi:hypothetical protein
MRSVRPGPDVSHSFTRPTLLSGTGSVPDAPSTVALSSILEDEEVKHLLFDLTLRLARACHELGKLHEAVRCLTHYIACRPDNLARPCPGYMHG